jgi:hypothetical protein
MGNITFSKETPMLAAIKTESINAENWKSSFLSFTSDWLDKVEKDLPMDSITDISKGLFQKRSQIMGQAWWFPDWKRRHRKLEQIYLECPSQTIWSLVVPNECKQYFETSLCKIQWDI